MKIFFISRQCKSEIVLLQHLTVFLFLLIVFVSTVNAQSENSNAQPVHGRKARTIPGKLLSEGSNTTPSGELKVLTYKLEEISPTQTVNIRGRETTLTGFRLTITASEKLTGGYRIWIDDSSYEAFGLGLYKIGIVMDSTALPNGATLAVSSLGVSNGEYVPTKLSVLPELLSVPPPYGYESATVGLNSNAIRLSRKPVKRYVNGRILDAMGIEIEITLSEPLPPPSALKWMGQIGDKEFPIGECSNPSRGRNVVCGFVSDETFNQLQDGEKINIKYGNGRLVNGATVERLNKGSLQ